MEKHPSTLAAQHPLQVVPLNDPKADESFTYWLLANDTT